MPDDGFLPMIIWIKKNRRLFFLFLAALVVLCLHAWYYYPFFSDDSLISLRYADRLVDGKGLTWTDGRPVEGYSNLLWVLLTALLHLVGVDLILAARLLGFLFMALVAFILTAHWSFVKTTLNDFPAALGLFFFSLAAPIAIWAIGGLEQPLYAGLIAVSIFLSIRVIETELSGTKILLGLSLVLGLICITRPDGPLFSVAAILSIGLGRWMARKNPLPLFSWLALGVFPPVFYGGQLLFRWLYYGELIPNTALVKIAPSLHHLQNGAMYLWKAWWSLFPFSLFVVIAIIAMLRLPATRSRTMPLLAIFLLWMPYVAFVGGDIFPGYRHFTPIIVVFAFAILEGANLAIEALRKTKLLYKRLAGAITLVSCILFVFAQFTDANNRSAVTERWEWDGEVVGRLLKEAFSEQQPLVAVTAAGCLPYWSELPSLDMLGLNDYYLPRNPPSNFGDGYLGHELGNGAYVFSQKPDIIIFNVGDKDAAFYSHVRLFRLKEFREAYTVIWVRGDYPYEYLATLWFHKYSPKIGIRQTDAEISIPGFLLGGDKTFACLNETGSLVAVLRPGISASVILNVPLNHTWDIQVIPDGQPVITELLEINGKLEIKVISDGQNPIKVEHIVLRRK